MNLIVHDKRFMFDGYSYPIHIVAFEHRSKLGYFDANYYEIGINKELQYRPKEDLIRVLRHEIAHYLTLLHYKKDVPDHGLEFRSICKRYGWDDAAFATFELDPKEIEQKSSAKEKIAKLINLGQSKNEHEAHAALQKAQELLIKWGSLENSDEEIFIARRILPAKRASQKLSAISKILRKFCVSPIINQGKEHTYLELFGKYAHVEVAEYIGIVLDRLFDDLWESEKGSTIRRTITAKHSFFRGIADGFLHYSTPTSDQKQAILIIEQTVENALHLAYPRLSKSTSRTKHDPKAYATGKQRGSHLNLTPPLSKPATQKNKLLSFSACAEMFARVY